MWERKKVTSEERKTGYIFEESVFLYLEKPKKRSNYYRYKIKS